MKNEIIKLGISDLEAEELIKTSKNIKKDIKLLKKNYPIQYLIGYVNFYGYKILVNKNVLIPRYETEFLVEKTIKYIKELNIKNPVILDLCTGSGCIAISLKKELKDATVYASDISSKALKICEKNIKLNNVEVKLIKSNLFNKIKNKKFDVIITNPPYVKINDKISPQVKFEPKKALYAKDNGNYIIKKIINDSLKYLKLTSLLAIETNNLTYKELKDKKYIFEKDLTGKYRYLFLMNKENKK